MSGAGLTPDRWQASLLESVQDRVLILCGRQMGKTQVASAIAVKTLLVEAPALILVLSPSERQSGEFAQRAFGIYDALGRPVPQTKRTELQLHLANGSRMIALPDSEKTIRGYAGAALLIIDEASRIDDALYRTVRPMLATSKGRLLALSTPFGKRGFFFEAWASTERWERVMVTADKCPRISAEFLAEERAALGERWYAQEYNCDFSDTMGAVFSAMDIDAAMSATVRPLFP